MSRHAAYDDTVIKQHRMTKTKIFRPYQSWSDTPRDPSLLEQLFEPIGAHVDSDVLFLSLSAGALAGGSMPDNGLLPSPPPEPAKLAVYPAGTITDTISSNKPTHYDITYSNTGDYGDIQVILYSNKHGVHSTAGIPYEEGLDTTTGNMTGAGDKITDWSLNIIGANGKTTYRSAGDNRSFYLSSGEYVVVRHESQNTSFADGYDVSTTYEAMFPDRPFELGQIQFQLTY